MTAKGKNAFAEQICVKCLEEMESLEWQAEDWWGDFKKCLTLYGNKTSVRTQLFTYKTIFTQLFDQEINSLP